MSLKNTFVFVLLFSLQTFAAGKSNQCEQQFLSTPLVPVVVSASQPRAADFVEYGRKSGQYVFVKVGDMEFRTTQKRIDEAVKKADARVAVVLNTASDPTKNRSRMNAELLAEENATSEMLAKLLTGNSLLTRKDTLGVGAIKADPNETPESLIEKAKEQVLGNQEKINVNLDEIASQLKLLSQDVGSLSPEPKTKTGKALAKAKGLALATPLLGTALTYTGKQIDKQKAKRISGRESSLAEKINVVNEHMLDNIRLARESAQILDDQRTKYETLAVQLADQIVVGELAFQTLQRERELIAKDDPTLTAILDTETLPEAAEFLTTKKQELSTILDTIAKTTIQIDAAKTDEKITSRDRPQIMLTLNGTLTNIAASRQVQLSAQSHRVQRGLVASTMQQSMEQQARAYAITRELKNSSAISPELLEESLRASAALSQRRRDDAAVDYDKILERNKKANQLLNVTTESLQNLGALAVDSTVFIDSSQGSEIQQAQIEDKK